LYSIERAKVTKDANVVWVVKVVEVAEVVYQ